MKKILIIGSGGREHALGWKLGQSNEISEIIFAPGNAGTEEGKGRNILIDGSKKDNFPALLDFVNSENIDLVVVGPDLPLAEGIVDYFNLNGYNRIFGPTQRAALLESDKFYSFDLMQQIGIPQANSVKCYSIEEAIIAITERATQNGIVIKARGLTGGKGVTVCNSKEQALSEIKNHSDKYGSDILIAERLFGQEFSVFGISDGKTILPLEISIQDHKRLLDGDNGPNTGGMGAYGPAPIASADVIKKIANDIMTPLIKKMKAQGNEYKGFLYAGMIMTKDGPKVIEFNVRFGDPECQPAMVLLKSDLYEILSFSLDGKLDQLKMELNPGSACCVVLVSQGYPESYSCGLAINGLDESNKVKGIKVFHAETKRNQNQILTSGGRVLGVTGYSPNGITDAQRIAYEGVSKINIPGKFHYRKDIASKALT